ncbi:MAG: WecB/TagA/CpsF family glycosyltransferase, partial [Cyanobacteria bacterium P01_F01_bin.42]
RGDYLSWLCERLQRQQGTHVVTLNAEMTMQARQNSDLADVIAQADLVIPDGAGIVLYLKLFGREISRCPGIELSQDLISYAGQNPALKVFFYGGAPEVAHLAAERWQRTLPQISIVGTENGYVKGDAQKALKTRLQDLQPDLIFVGLGVPRQEYWIAQHRHLCPNATWVGVGGSFDIWSETKQRAPQWLCDNNLEWTYRLYQEPWRWKRMMALPHFALLALFARFTSKRPA